MSNKVKITLIIFEVILLVGLLLLGVGCQQKWIIITDDGPRFDWYVEKTPEKFPGVVDEENPDEVTTVGSDGAQQDDVDQTESTSEATRPQYPPPEDMKTDDPPSENSKAEQSSEPSGGASGGESSQEDWWMGEF